MIRQDAELDFTVAICTYNGADRFPEVLECLRQQLDTENIRWEIIIVDNNSTDDTAAIIREAQENWPHPFALRYAFEPKQGAGHARQKAVRLAHSPWIGFLDDDNLPSPVWVAEAYRFAYQFAQQNPKIGVFSSRIRGIFESQPPVHFERIASCLALIDRGAEPLKYLPEKKLLPPGAGMVVRRNAWLEHVPQNPVLSGRAGNKMLTGEDLEVVLHIQRAGWEVWYTPTMQLGHKIPAQRLTRSYLTRLMRGIGLSRHRTRMLSVPGWRRPFMFIAYALNDIRKILTHLLTYGSQVWTDTVAASEMTLYCYSLLSPYYLGYYRLQQWWTKPVPPPVAVRMSSEN